MSTLLTFFSALPWHTAALYLLIENLLLFLLSLAGGYLLLALYKTHPVADPPDPLQWQEVAWATSCVLLNTVVTLAGWFLWKYGIITIYPAASPAKILLDLVVLVIAMDLAMYLTHRIAHLPFIYPWMHATHHHYDKPRPLNLFVLNPFEVLGFGALWLTVITLYPASWTGILLYLALNLLFGTVGHLGVEPLPKSFMKLPLLRHFGTSTFHARHHQNTHVNYGFYTDLWDRLFKTLYHHYEKTFASQDPALSKRHNIDTPPITPQHTILLK